MLRSVDAIVCWTNQVHFELFIRLSGSGVPSSTSPNVLPSTVARPVLQFSFE
jgi:hypothetical protein